MALNWALALGLTAATMTLFWWIGYTADPARAASLRTSLDDAIPFVPWTVYLYSWVYTSMLYPLFVVRSPDLFRRVVAAYAVVIVFSLATFALFPVTAVGFRPDPSTLAEASFADWGLRLTYFVDPPMNLFPSQHLSIATISMLSAWTARRAFGLAILPIVAGIAVSICTVKQHFIADGVAGLALAFGVYRIMLARWDPGARREADVASTWRGPAAYLAFHAAFYLALFVAYRAGYRPCA
jgi:hypothetical protein